MREVTYWNGEVVVTGTVESVSVVSDESGWELHLTDTDGQRFVLNVHGVSADLVKAVEPVAEYWQEGLEMALQHAGFRGDEPGGYDRSDPKHPEWHSTHARLWDERTKV